MPLYCASSSSSVNTIAVLIQVHTEMQAGNKVIFLPQRHRYVCTHGFTIAAFSLPSVCIFAPRCWWRRRSDGRLSHYLQSRSRGKRRGTRAPAKLCVWIKEYVLIYVKGRYLLFFHFQPVLIAVCFFLCFRIGAHLCTSLLRDSALMRSCLCSSDTERILKRWIRLISVWSFTRE